ncbi:glycosyltransferase family 4 protein [Microbacterium sp. NPDC064584]|uniref:glycosyltransferase family 4 protein n=1 Tax=Microbacterium sp. NPDC064584 TaxID=3155817 RepID=UPI0034254A68
MVPTGSPRARTSSLEGGVLSTSLVFINNSRETYTSSHSGAIATCIRAVTAEAAAGGVEPKIITRRHATGANPDPWPSLYEVPAIRPLRTRAGMTVSRARRRVNGWARPDQWTYSSDVERILRTIRPRTVIVNNDPEIAVRLRRRFPAMHVIHWFHNLELTSDRFRRHFAADTGITSMAVSAYLARAVEHAYGMSPGRVRVNLNGVDSAEFAPAERPERVPTVGFLGRIAVEKGLDVLLDAAMMLAGSDVAFTVQIIGDTNWGERNSNPYIRAVEQQIVALGDHGVRVTNLGHLGRAAVPAALASSDIHVFPSRWDEPFGLALLEGMASGQAVIASATGGAPEVLAGTGALFAREDARALAGILRPLLRDRQSRIKLGDEARRRAKELTWHATWQRMQALIEDGPS